MRIGSWVDYEVKGYGNGRGRGLVVGEMRYSRETSKIVLLCDEQAFGMPINVSWCKSTGVEDLASALRYRKRYEDKLPGHFKPLKYKTKATDSNVSP